MKPLWFIIMSGVFAAHPAVGGTARPAPQWQVSALTGQTEFVIKDERYRGLSGITWAGGTQFYCVSDRQRAIIPLDLFFSPDTGQLLIGKLGAAIPLKTGLRDFEGIAWVSASSRVYISAESPAGIAAFTTAGKAGPVIALPECYRHPAANKSMESLTWNDTVQRFWTVNEETLPADGAAVDAEGGAVVRLQEFDALRAPLRQFAWRTEAPSMRIRNTGSGVSDLCLLADGTLLVLERSISGFQLCTRLFRADFTKATPLSAAPLAPGKFTPAAKHLLYEQSTGLTNYEGIALGPMLMDKSRMLVLLADSGDGASHYLKPLRLTLK